MTMHVGVDTREPRSRSGLFSPIMELDPPLSLQALGARATWHRCGQGRVGVAPLHRPSRKLERLLGALPWARCRGASRAPWAPGLGEAAKDFPLFQVRQKWLPSRPIPHSLLAAAYTSTAAPTSRTGKSGTPPGANTTTAVRAHERSLRSLWVGSVTP